MSYSTNIIDRGPVRDIRSVDQLWQVVEEISLEVLDEFSNRLHSQDQLWLREAYKTVADHISVPRNEFGVPIKVKAAKQEDGNDRDYDEYRTSQKVVQDLMHKKIFSDVERLRDDLESLKKIKTCDLVDATYHLAACDPSEQLRRQLASTGRVYSIFYPWLKHLAANAKHDSLSLLLRTLRNLPWEPRMVRNSDGNSRLLDYFIELHGQLTSGSSNERKKQLCLSIEATVVAMGRSSQQSIKRSRSSGSLTNGPQVARSLKQSAQFVAPRRSGRLRFADEVNKPLEAIKEIPNRKELLEMVQNMSDLFDENSSGRDEVAKEREHFEKKRQRIADCLRSVELEHWPPSDQGLPGLRRALCATASHCDCPLEMPAKVVPSETTRAFPVSYQGGTNKPIIAGESNIAQSKWEKVHALLRDLFEDPDQAREFDRCWVFLDRDRPRGE